MYSRYYYYSICYCGADGRCIHHSIGGIPTDTTGLVITLLSCDTTTLNNYYYCYYNYYHYHYYYTTA